MRVQFSPQANTNKRISFEKNYLNEVSEASINLYSKTANRSFKDGTINIDEEVIERNVSKWWNKLQEFMTNPNNDSRIKTTISHNPEDKSELIATIELEEGVKSKGKQIPAPKTAWGSICLNCDNFFEDLAHKTYLLKARIKD